MKLYWHKSYPDCLYSVSQPDEFGHSRVYVLLECENGEWNWLPTEWASDLIDFQFEYLGEI